MSARSCFLASLVTSGALWCLFGGGPTALAGLGLWALGTLIAFRTPAPTK